MMMEEKKAAADPELFFCRDIYYAKYYSKGVRGKWSAGKKNMS